MKQVLIIVLLIVSANAMALENTATNRSKEADRYLKTMSLAEMIKDMTEQMAVNLPPDQRAEFKALMTEHMDMSAVTKVMKYAMVIHFTTNKLMALADFYGYPIGRSAMKKFGAYMAEGMPSIQAEVLRAHAKAI